MWWRAAAVASCAVLAVGFVPTSAEGAGQAATEACSAAIGSVTAQGEHVIRGLKATNPPSLSAGSSAVKLYAPGVVRLSTYFEDYPGSGGGTSRNGNVVIGDSLYGSFYYLDAGGESMEHRLTRIGGGWSNFTQLERATFDKPVGSGIVPRSDLYALRKDGVLFRWHHTSAGWRSTGSYPGFAAVKSMAVISKTQTYDTFIANTRGGALYTIRIPTTSPMKPIVRPVRTSTWQGFETLIAAACGQYGTLLLGIDKDTGNGYAYAVGHANGTATVINGLGKVNGSFTDPVQFRFSGVSFYDWLNGE
ncbi:hypothetical protein EV649_6044 [Kribbella sp. VKM Ac-2569]|uniref:hypothetical protein n=1 Tax=Kribbella sp. VKM Ac-2569 TaxID=2512220 RepID=UPI0010EC7697|nr:hypothetical protein [Kribbella sp. VKM Ac-2569]RZT15256.1 hypothetical protein EV649_6044 [Kribbella sp. VKM Ac-2569]